MTKKYTRPIIRKFSNLKQIPWISLTNLPTPVERLNGLENELRFNGIWIKRDDLTSTLYGGNKPRKLEYLLADAKERGKNEIKTVGGIGSNHALATCIFCNELGLKCKLFLVEQPNTEHCRENLLLDYYYGAELNYCQDSSEFPEDIDIPRGGTNPLSNLGHVNAALELKEQIENNQIPEPDSIFITKGSSGTLSGLLLGLELLGLKTKIYGVTVIDSKLKEDVINLAIETGQLIEKHNRKNLNITYEKIGERLIVLNDFYGKGYGFPTKQGERAVKILKKTDNIILDSTYTGKTCSAMISLIKENQWKFKNKNILFWNTFSSVDLIDKAKQVNYRNLPEDFHKFFNDKIPLVSEN